tara:strand:+ start:2867 stop:3064 length:198 start_codon:yes stop_codon:yes gene_type:complete
MSKEYDQFNNGAKHGFNLALLAVRNVDRTIAEGIDLDSQIKYNTQKDMIYKIYTAIKKEREANIN